MQLCVLHRDQKPKGHNSTGVRADSVHKETGSLACHVTLVVCIDIIHRCTVTSQLTSCSPGSSSFASLYMIFFCLNIRKESHCVWEVKKRVYNVRIIERDSPDSWRTSFPWCDKMASSRMLRWRRPPYGIRIAPYRPDVLTRAQPADRYVYQEISQMYVRVSRWLWSISSVYGVQCFEGFFVQRERRERDFSYWICCFFWVSRKSMK